MTLQPSRNSQRGAASIEAVVILPFLILVYFGVALVFGRYDATQRSWASARSCAWAYSQRGCQGDLPAECGAATAGPSEIPENPELDEAARTEQVQARGEEQQKVLDGMNHALGDPRRTLFGEYTTVTAAIDFRAPLLFGEHRRVSVTYHLACNLKEQRLSDIAKDFVDAVLP
jgi:hypothetical protein